MFFVQINHTGKGFLFLIFREIKLRKYSSLHKLFYSLVVKYALKHSNLYQNQELCRILLLDVENGDSKEKLATQNLTIEHIMP